MQRIALLFLVFTGLIILLTNLVDANLVGTFLLGGLIDNATLFFSANSSGMSPSPAAECNRFGVMLDVVGAALSV